MTAKSIALFIVAAVAEIGGAYLMWQAVKEGRGLLFAAAGAVALTGYGAIAALQPDANFGRVLAAYGGVFIVGSLLWASPSTASSPIATTSPARSSASPASL